MSLKAWQGKTIYFILIDRFYNGDKSNDDFGKGEYDPKDNNCFQGGDLKGITLKLPFIRKMGFDAVWITPPVHNQWINPYIATRGFHGYWAYDFTKVDPHFGTLEDYKKLVETAHGLGIKVIQDIVVNHTGNYFTVDEKEYDPKDPARAWKPLAEAYPPEGEPKAPNDPVFCMNNPNVKEHREAGIYNFTPNISDFKSREQTLTYAMGDLDDINLKSPLAAKRMKEIYRYWIDEVGIDAYRVDTVYYTPEDFYEGFLYDENPGSPGVKRFAQSKGIKDFFVFGEVWSYDYRAINRYLKEGAVSRLDSAIDLPLNEALTEIFFCKAATELIRKPLQAKRHNRNLWVNFLDNHDVERIYSRANWACVQQSLVALFTLPGIPCVNYGTEAGFKSARQNMFRDEYYDEKSKQASFLKRLIRFRKEHPAFSEGKCEVERTSFAGGVLSYSVSHGSERYLVVFNTSTDRMLYDLGAGRRFESLLASDKKMKFAAGSLRLAPESYCVLKAAAAGRAAKGKPRPSIRMRVLSGARSGSIPIAFKFACSGKTPKVSLLCDDNYDRRIPIPNPKTGRFLLDAAELGNGRHKIGLLAEACSGAVAVSNLSEIIVKNPYRPLSRLPVPGANKAGIGARIYPPADPSYTDQLSMEEVGVYTSGKDLRIRLKMTGVTDDWNPPNGYDHVYFSVFFDFPRRKGGRFFPKLGYARDDFEFNAGFLLYGWGAQSFGPEDSSAEVYGEPLTGEVSQAVDLKARTISFTFSNRFFGGLKSFSGTKIFISTWDGYLGDFRRIAGEKKDWEFYSLDGGAPKTLPKIYDHILLKL